MAGAGALRLVEPGLVLEDETWQRGWGILLAPRAPRTPPPRRGRPGGGFRRS